MSILFLKYLKQNFYLILIILIHIYTGHCLDTLARKALWEAGLDYLHGTGHGVGCYLNVHEGN